MSQTNCVGLARSISSNNNNKDADDKNNNNNIDNINFGLKESSNEGVQLENNSIISSPNGSSRADSLEGGCTVGRTSLAVGHLGTEVDVASTGGQPGSVDATRSLEQPDTGSDSGSANKPKRNPYCSRCRNHGKSAQVKGHKRHCEYRDCQCEGCKLVEFRQFVSAAQIRRRRNQKQDEENGHLAEVTPPVLRRELTTDPSELLVKTLIGAKAARRASSAASSASVGPVVSSAGPTSAHPLPAPPANLALLAGNPLNLNRLLHNHQRLAVAPASLNTEEGPSPSRSCSDSSQQHQHHQAHLQRPHNNNNNDNKNGINNNKKLHPAPLSPGEEFEIAEELHQAFGPLATYAWLKSERFNLEKVREIIEISRVSYQNILLDSKSRNGFELKQQLQAQHQLQLLQQQQQQPHHLNNIPPRTIASELTNGKQSERPTERRVSAGSTSGCSMIDSLPAGANLREANIEENGSHCSVQKDRLESTLTGSDKTPTAIVGLQHQQAQNCLGHQYGAGLFGPTPEALAAVSSAASGLHPSMWPAGLKMSSPTAAAAAAAAAVIQPHHLLPPFIHGHPFFYQVHAHHHPAYSAHQHQVARHLAAAHQPQGPGNLHLSAVQQHFQHHQSYNHDQPQQDQQQHHHHQQQQQT